MRNSISITAAAICLVFGASSALAQPAAAPPKDAGTSTITSKMMAFDKNKDGKLTKEEITDARLVRLFDQADTDKDGVVTKEELTALAATLEAEVPAGGRAGRGGGPGGPDGGGPPEGRPDNGGPGGPGAGVPGGGGPGAGRGPGGRGAPGQILPPMLQDALNLTPDQKKQLADLQKEVDTKLANILTPEQQTQLKQMRQRGPGGGGGSGGGGPGGGGPGGGGNRPPR